MDSIASRNSATRVDAGQENGRSGDETEFLQRLEDLTRARVEHQRSMEDHLLRMDAIDERLGPGFPLAAPQGGIATTKKGELWQTTKNDGLPHASTGKICGAFKDSELV